MTDDYKQPILTEPIKNQEIEIKPINQPNFSSVNYPGGQGYLGNDPSHNSQPQPGGVQNVPMQPQNRPPMTGGGMGGMGGQMGGPGQFGGPGQYGGQIQMMGGPNQNMPPAMMGQAGGWNQGPGGFGGRSDDRNPPNRNMVTMDDEYTNMKYEKSYPCYEDCMQCCCNCCGKCRQFIPCLCVSNPNIEVPQSWCALKMRFGRFIETIHAGLQFVTPSTERLIMVDLQTQTLDLVKQNIITKDNITAAVDTAINYKVVNPRYTMFRLNNLQESVTNITYSAIRTVCGVYTLNEMQEKKGEITHQLQLYIGDRVKQWGIIIEQIFIKDVVLSSDLQQTLSSAAKMQ